MAVRGNSSASIRFIRALFRGIVTFVLNTLQSARCRILVRIGTSVMPLMVKFELI
jgi:hypothetical protein